MACRTRFPYKNLFHQRPFLRHLRNIPKGKTQNLTSSTPPNPIWIDAFPNVRNQEKINGPYYILDVSPIKLWIYHTDTFLADDADFFSQMTQIMLLFPEYNKAKNYEKRK
jgi:hypothetical protein